MTGGVLLEDLPACAAAIVGWKGGADHLDWWEVLAHEAEGEEMRALLSRARTPEWTGADAARLVGLVAAAAARSEVAFQMEWGTVRKLSAEEAESEARSDASDDEDLDHAAWQADAYAAARQRRPKPKPWVKPSERARLRGVTQANKSRAKVHALMPKYQALRNAGYSQTRAISSLSKLKTERDNFRKWLKKQSGQER